jgi:hypothetical protein
MSQRTYAALDVIVPLEIFLVLKELPNLNCRLTWEDAKAGTMVDIFPSTGAISALSVSAVGTIKSVNPGDTWIVPPGLNTKQTKRTVSSSDGTVIVTVSKVFARGLKVPRVTKILDKSNEKSNLTIGELAENAGYSTPFDVALSVRSLSKHLPKRSELSQPVVFAGLKKTSCSSKSDEVATTTPTINATKTKVMTNPYLKKAGAVAAPPRDTTNPPPSKRQALTTTVANPYKKRQMVQTTAKEPAVPLEAADDGAFEDVLQQTIDAAEAGNRGFDYGTFDLTENDLAWISLCLHSDTPLHEIAQSMVCDKWNPWRQKN